MSSKKDLLKQKAKPKLAVVEQATMPVKTSISAISEIDQITREIQNDLSELHEIADWWKVKKERAAEIQRTVVERLIYVRDNTKKLLPGRTFEDYITKDIGITKGWVYEQLRAYNVCVEFNKKELFGTVAPRILASIAKEPDKNIQRELLERAPSLTREDLQNEKDKGVEKKVFKKTSVHVDKKKMVLKIDDIATMEMIESFLRAKGIELLYS